MVFSETCHALRFGNNMTDVNLRMFQWRTLAQLVPMMPDGWQIKFGDFAKSEVNFSNTNSVRLVYLLKRPAENCFCGFKLTHSSDKLYDMRFFPNRQLILRPKLWSNLMRYLKSIPGNQKILKILHGI